MRPVDYEVTEEDQSVLTKTQIADVEQKEEATMRTLRIFLRNLVTRLAQEKFKRTIFDVLHHINIFEPDKRTSDSKNSQSQLTKKKFPIIMTLSKIQWIYQL